MISVRRSHAFACFDRMNRFLTRMVETQLGFHRMAVFSLVVIMLGSIAQAAPPDAQAVQGTWWILGNTTRGVLQIEIDKENRVSGSIYQQPIRGTWQPELGQLSFVRYSDEAAKVPMQSWSGKAELVDCNSRGVVVLEGTFRTLYESSEEEKARHYKWTGQLSNDPAPVLDLNNLQGVWEIEGITRCLRRDVKLPDELGLDKVGVQFEIRGSQLKKGDVGIASLANDLQSASLAGQVGFEGSRVMVLTTSTGQGCICSYFIENDLVEIAYPHTTSCHRGSGHILRLKRVKEGQPEKTEPQK